MNILALTSGRKYLALLALALLIVIPACNPSPIGNAVTINLVAQNLAFDKTSITVPAGATVTVVFNNKDTAPHNFAVYENLAGSQTKTVYIGDTFTGPATKNRVFTAPAAGGSYFFECDVHPATMNGKFIVQ